MKRIVPGAPGASAIEVVAVQVHGRAIDDAERHPGRAGLAWRTDSTPFGPTMTRIVTTSGTGAAVVVGGGSVVVAAVVVAAARSAWRPSSPALVVGLLVVVVRAESSMKG